MRGRYVKRGALGRFVHERRMTPIDKQDVVRMNRDTLYSFAVFDLDVAPVAVVLPDAGKRFMSMQVISQDHYTTEVVYAPGRHERAMYSSACERSPIPRAPPTWKPPAMQDRIQVEQANRGKFVVPSWDPKSRDKARAALERLASLGPVPG